MQHAFASRQKSKPGVLGNARGAPHRSAAPHGMSNHRILQRTCTACAAEKKAMDDETLLQRRTTEDGASGPPLVDAVLARPGAPLDAHVRGRMENRFNHDFGGVRIHDDALAHESARSVGAAAYTVGSGIVFGPGRYRPGTREGGHLLAHELAHTVQQGGLQRRAIDGALAVDPYPALEQEAERAADAAMSPDSVTMPRLSRVAATVLSRAAEARTWKPTTMVTSPPVLGEERSPEPRSRVRAYRVAELELPGPKMNKASLDVWKAKASAQALEATINAGETFQAIRDKRPSSDTLRGIWLQNLGWDRKTLETNWKNAGGDTKAYKPVDDDAVCEIDHIVELQFGGNNTADNMQLLQKENNASAGRDLWQQVVSLARQITATDDTVEQVILHFDKVVSGGTYKCDECCKIEKKLTALEKKGVGPTDSEAGDADALLAEYPIAAGGLSTTLRVTAVGAATKTKEIVDDLFNPPIAENKSGSTLVPGITLLKLTRAGKTHKMAGEFSENTKTRLRIDIKPGNPVDFSVKDGALSLSEASKDKKGVKFNYPYLSPGEFTTLHITPEGLTGEGKIYPTIPFLGPLGVRFAPGELTVTKGLDQKALKPPFPGFRITKGELALELAPEFKPSGILAFAIGPEKKPVALGEMTAGLEGGNFAVKGTLTAQIPGLDTAVGTVTYVKDAGWNGRIELKTSKIPNTKNVSVVVTLGPDGFAAEGGLTIVLPGEGNTVALHVAQKKDRFALTGDSTLTLPVKGMEPVTLSFEHDGEHIKGSGHTSISFHGLKGDVAVAYHDGKVSGKGKIDIKKGRAAGALAVNLSEQNRISGEGSITYQITDDLVATAGIILGEDESVRLKGALEIVKPIELFPAAKGKKTLLAVPTITIPIPGASIGPVGLVVKIDGGIEIHYQVGPGELRNTKIEAAFNPLDEKPDLDLLFGTQLHVGANAGIGGYVRGALAIDAVIASVSGGLTVGAQADLEGNAQADLKIHYTKSRFEFDAKGMIEAGLALGLTLDADVRAEAGIGPFTASWMKVWHLAAYKLDTGLRFGLQAPLHYDSDKPFKAPSVGDIKWTLPTLDPQMLLDKAMNSAAASETKK